MSDDVVSEVQRIRTAIARFDAVGHSGTYKAQEEDYARGGVSVLRDVRLLLDVLDATEAEIRRLRHVRDRAAFLVRRWDQRDRMIVNDTWESAEAIPVYGQIERAEQQLRAALSPEAPGR